MSAMENNTREGDYARLRAAPIFCSNKRVPRADFNPLTGLIYIACSHCEQYKPSLLQRTMPLPGNVMHDRHWQLRGMMSCTRDGQF